MDLTMQMDMELSQTVTEIRQRWPRPTRNLFKGIRGRQDERLRERLWVLANLVMWKAAKRCRPHIRVTGKPLPELVREGRYMWVWDNMTRKVSPAVWQATNPQTAYTVTYHWKGTVDDPITPLAVDHVGKPITATTAPMWTYQNVVWTTDDSSTNTGLVRYGP